MKKKRYLSLLLAAPLLLLAGCSTTPELPLEPNWFSNTGTEPISSTFEETLVYAVSFEKSAAALDSDFYMNYSDASYKTKLVGSTANNKNTYVYTTELTAKVTFTLNNESFEHNDSVTTRVEFYSAADGLRPISSTREAHVTVPRTKPDHAPSTLSEGYKVCDYKVEISYDEALEKAIYTNTGANITEKEMKISGKGSFFDNEQIYLMLRATEFSSAMTFRTIDFPANAVATMKIANGPTAVTLKQAVKYKDDEEAVERDYDAYQIGLAYSKTNSGTTRTLTFAQRKNRDSNTHRNVMLKCEDPIVYSHGTLIYRLIEANFG